VRFKIDRSALRNQLREALIEESSAFDRAHPDCGALDTLIDLLAGQYDIDPDFLDRNLEETEERLRELVEEHGADRLPELTARAIAEQVVDFLDSIKEASDDESGGFIRLEGQGNGEPIS
jgi:hypothetical protein